MIGITGIVVKLSPVRDININKTERIMKTTMTITGIIVIMMVLISVTCGLFGHTAQYIGATILLAGLVVVCKVNMKIIKAFWKSCIHDCVYDTETEIDIE